MIPLGEFQESLRWFQRAFDSIFPSSEFAAKGLVGQMSCYYGRKSDLTWEKSILKSEANPESTWKKSFTGVSPPGDWKEEPPVAAAVATACIPPATTAENGRLPREKNFVRERQRAKLYFFEL